jgi:hypothetical protein
MGKRAGVHMQNNLSSTVLVNSFWLLEKFFLAAHTPLFALFA